MELRRLERAGPLTVVGFIAALEPTGVSANYHSIPTPHVWRVLRLSV